MFSRKQYQVANVICGKKPGSGLYKQVPLKTKMDSNENVGSTKAKWFVERNLQAAELPTDRQIYDNCVHNHKQGRRDVLQIPVLKQRCVDCTIVGVPMQMNTVCTDADTY